MADDTNYESSQELSPDAEIILFHIITTSGANIYCKSGPSQDYLGNTYESVPISLSSETASVDGETQRPILTIGGDDLDLAFLKPAVASGELDEATVNKHVVELDDLLADNDIKNTTVYRIKQVKDYNRFNISLVLAGFTPSALTTIPYRKYTRTAFPNVEV